MQKIIEGKRYYYPRLGKRVVVRFFDEQSGYAYVRDVQRNSYTVRASELEEIQGDSDMSIRDTLEREG